MSCVLISMWFVRCKLCRVHCPTLTSTHRWTLLFSHWETPWNTAWQQQKKDWPPFQSSEKIKCNSKFDCLVYELLYIKDIKPSLNTQADSIRAKLFTWQFCTFLLLLLFLLFVFLNRLAIILCIFQILYIHFTPYTFSLLNFIMA